MRFGHRAVVEVLVMVIVDVAVLVIEGIVQVFMAMAFRQVRPGGQGPSAARRGRGVDRYPLTEDRDRKQGSDEGRR